MQAVNSWIADFALPGVPAVVHGLPSAHQPRHFQPLAANVQLNRSRRPFSQSTPHFCIILHADSLFLGTAYRLLTIQAVHVRYMQVTSD